MTVPLDLLISHTASNKTAMGDQKSGCWVGAQTTESVCIHVRSCTGMVMVRMMIRDFGILLFARTSSVRLLYRKG